jgi:hypothetical protein
MQGIERTGKNMPAQEQWKTGAKQCEKQWKQNNGNNEKRGLDATLSEAAEPGAALPRGSKKPPASSGGAAVAQIRD